MRGTNKTYEVSFEIEIPLLSNYITEEEYFTYYQNANDPTFENYNFEKPIETNYDKCNDEEVDDLPF